FIGLDSQYRSKFNSKEDLDSIANQPSTNIIHASIGLTSPGGNWDVTLWARNITDEETLQVVFNSIAQPGSFNGFPNDPTTFGITLRWFY
ncbi:MAG: TonB-dependent receptor, partial [Proteobacteria bacterium]|nr:TonB-dependent receptor [Pseudomonadota bacterium]